MNIASGHGPGDPDPILARARKFLAANRSDEAYASYLEILSRDPSHPAALHELGCLAHADGYRSAARSIYGQIVHHWPRDPVGRVNLGNILYEEGDLTGAQKQFEIALEIDPGSTDAHRGLGHVMWGRGDVSAADRYWRQSFPEQAIAVQLYRGKAPALSVLLLVSARGGNIPTRHILDDRIFAVTVLYTEYYRPELPLPQHRLVFNAIGDADLCEVALAAADRIVARTDAPVINLPAQVARTGRAANAARLACVPGVRAPRIMTVPRADLDTLKALAFPLLLRAPGFHTGQYFARVESHTEMQAAAAGLPGEMLLAIEYLDARGPGGMARKYRVMCIDGVLYPMHLAIGANWKVHYFTADMAQDASHRAEEQRFLEDMPGTLGAPALTALARIGEMLELDYGGFDFALDTEKNILLFEANATMVIIPPSPEPMWDYRRAPVQRALDAAKNMLVARSQSRDNETVMYGRLGP